MRWISPNLKDSVIALLGGLDMSPEVLVDRTEVIRAFMLKEMGDCGEKSYPRLMRNLRYAQDAQALWYARGEMMAALAELHGESIARDKVERISDKFRGLLPRGLGTRQSSLTH